MTPTLPYAIAWDLDGVLVDSGAAHRVAWEAIGRELGRPFTAEHFRQTFGLANPDIFRIAWGMTDPAQVASGAARKEALYRENAHDVRLLPGAVELVRASRAAGWRQAIGSSTPQANIDLLLGVLGLEGLFDAIISGDDLTRGKPDPQVFLLAFERLGVPPVRGIVIEDAVAGVQAGRAAGARVIGVTTTRPRADLLAAGADWAVDSLATLIVPQLAALIEQRANA